MAFKTSLRVRFGDEDHAQIVYYPRFFHFFHCAFEDFFDHQGHPYRACLDEDRKTVLPRDPHTEGGAARGQGHPRGSFGAVRDRCLARQGLRLVKEGELQKFAGSRFRRSRGRRWCRTIGRRFGVTHHLRAR